MTDHLWKIDQLTAEQQVLQNELAAQLDISPVAALILVKRGITSTMQARAYVRHHFDTLADPFLMKDMDKAVQRLDRAITNHEHILIYGDYDVDGTTAVASMYRFLLTLTDNLDIYIPDRYTEGYGISTQGVDYAHQHECSLIIALDCGIKAHDKVDYANSLGIDFIICDHHTPSDTIPNAVAVLNMKRSDCPYPYKELSGCGVGMRLTEAYRHYKTKITNPNEWSNADKATYSAQLQLLALSIASDIVPLTGENRTYAHFGLKQINERPIAGIRALLDISGAKDKEINISDLVYKIGPRINASGRIKSGIEAVKLLISDDISFTKQQASEIEDYNSKRKEFDNNTTEEALAMLRQDPNNDSLTTTVVFSPNWHKGVVGIAASRLIETFYRPTIVLTAGDDNIISGSARSVKGFDIYSAIDSCSDLLTNFGGHLYAAGLSMHKEHLDQFKQRFEQYVSRHLLPEHKQPVIEADAEILLSDITDRLYHMIKYMEPFGPENSRPVFVSRNLTDSGYSRTVGKEGEHLRLDITDGTGRITGIAFRQGHLIDYLKQGNPIDLCYEISENVFNGQRSLQIMVLDIKTK